jgi:hypothetical protein
MPKSERSFFQGKKIILTELKAVFEFALWTTNIIFRRLYPTKSTYGTTNPVFRNEGKGEAGHVFSNPSNLHFGEFWYKRGAFMLISHSFSLIFANCTSQFVHFAPIFGLFAPQFGILTKIIIKASTSTLW